MKSLAKFPLIFLFCFLAKTIFAQTLHNSEINPTISEKEIIEQANKYEAGESIILLTFEGLGNTDNILNFYNGGTSTQGFSGTNYGIYFGGNTLSIIDADVGGSGNFAWEPSPSTVMFFLTGSAVMNFPNGFQNGFSFYYTSSSQGTVYVYDGLDGSGNLLTSATFPALPLGTIGGDPTGYFDNWQPFGVSFSGTARSIDFTGVQNECGFDNITFGSANPFLNLPPVPQDFPSVQPVVVPFGQTYNLNVKFLSPESGQITTAIVNPPAGLQNFSSNVVAGNVCNINIQLTGASNNLGLHVIEFIATDNGSPPESTTTTLQLNVTGFMQIDVEPSSMVESLCPNSTSVQQFSIANSGDGDVTFSISDNVSWLSQSPSSGTILPGNTAIIQVNYNTSGMTPNIFSGQININSNVPSTPNITLPVALEVLPSLATYSTLTTGDNENNEGAGLPDNDLNVHLCKGDPKLPVEFNFFVNQRTIQSAELIINAFDVDLAPMAGVPYPEKNEVYINGYYIGDLTGMNDLDQTTSLAVPSAYIIPGPNGKNLVQIFLSTEGKYWCTIIESAELRIYNCN
jgi:hypothetical protein